MYQLLIIAVIGLLFLAVRDFRKTPPEKRKGLMLRYGLYAIVAVIILLTVTGRMHWLAAAIAALFPIARTFLPWLFRLLPFGKSQGSRSHSAPTPAAQSNISLEQALEMYGFDKLPDEAKIVQRYKELIQKNHPDRGGSDYLAAQINQAKTVLLAALTVH